MRPNQLPIETLAGLSGGWCRSSVRSATNAPTPCARSAEWLPGLDANLTAPAPLYPPMTLALLIALAGSLVATVIVRRLEQR